MPHYDYPRPMLTVDIFLLRLKDNHLEVLLIQRKNDPFKNKWALPGGYVEIEEPIESAAKRELLEETGIENIDLVKMDVFGEPGRDPRGRTITIVYFGVIPFEVSNELKPGDDAAESRWYSLSNLPELAFDHNHIVEVCHKKFQNNLLQKFWFLLFLDKEFSAEEILQLANNISEPKLPVAKIQDILFNLPFVKKVKDKQTFFKEISNDDLLKLDESKLINICQNILKN